MKVIGMLVVFIFSWVNVCFAEKNDDPKALEVFEASRLKKVVSPKYPRIASSRAEEGWVVVNYMVDTGGEPFEPTVVSSSGPKSFERAAISALKKAKFEPATLDGEPVESSGFFRYIFSMETDQFGASRRFVSNYKKFAKAMNDSDKTVAEDYLNIISEKGTRNHYESAYLAYAKSVYASVYGTPVEQMRYLWEALRYENHYDDGTVYLPKELVAGVRLQLFLLELKNKYFAEALKTYKLIEKNEEPEVVEQFRGAVEEIEALRENDVSYAVESSTNDDGFWMIDLHKQGFYVDNVSGDLSEIKLRCKKRFVFFQFVEANQYEVPKSWGSCRLQLLGAANTGFRLVQL